MNSMGERLRAARIAAGFRTARDAARHHDWNEDTLRGHEVGHRPISKKEAYNRYAPAFGVTATWLLTGKEETAKVNSAELEAKAEVRKLRTLIADIEAQLAKRGLRLNRDLLTGDLQLEDTKSA